MRSPTSSRLATALCSLIPMGIGLCCAISTAKAASITVTDPFLQYYNVGPNDLQFTSGEFVRYGATTVVPNGAASPPTTGVATTTNLATSATITRTISFIPSPVVPSFFSGQLTICTTNCTATGNNNPANLTGPWNITFSNPGTTPTSTTNQLSLAGPGEIPFVNSVTLSGSTATPTFSWSPPPGLIVDGYRINIYQNNLEQFNSSNQLINSGQVTSANVGPTVQSYTVQPSDFTIPGHALLTDTQYTIEISVLQTRDGSSTNLSNNNVSAISRVYSNFTVPSQSTLPGPINLPTTTVQGNQVTYGFNLSVAPGVTYFIDPTVATGYIYQTGQGDPNFKSVTLPDIGNPNPYELLLWNGTSFVFDTDLSANTPFSFGSVGVNEFEILGIDPSLGLDPNNTTAFITGLTFEGAGNFTGTMTPVTTDVAAVPEPASFSMLLTGLLGVLLIRRRKVS